ncbi:interleukin-22 receptor subunit alpha-2 [Austrofundulus limnaeus]|uniref:Interleukin-22 receptor subunit alpha-2 n=1 Tax=Austrofundulus limnaeus TaxID=52670 RepID=A0A2I4DAQ4_AUSLI|nr:PREDICTED: interleukin-20 receptor subunit alpha-like [Austrofundulus limnaeus]
MTRLLLGAVLLGYLSDHIAAQVMLPAPSQVMFKSTDYKNVLHWTPPTNSSSLQYKVQWKIYGEPDWLDAESCQGIHKRHCDLSSVTSKTSEWYYARVSAVSALSSSRSAWTLSPRFSPRWDTKITPPSLKASVTQQGIVVQVKASRGLVRKMHRSLLYNVFVIHANKSEEVFEVTCCSNLTLTKMNPRTKYCLQAQTVIPWHVKSSVRSTAKCIKTP